MLAILQIKMEWTKESRTPAGSVMRQKYYEPLKTEEDVPLLGTGIFMKICDYSQQDGKILCASEPYGLPNRQPKHTTAVQPFMGRDEHTQKMAYLRSQTIKREKGAFYPTDKISIPGVEIIEEADQCWRIRWFDNGRGMPRRRGGNEDFGKKGSRLAGQPSTLNETAFILRKGDSGILKYNYRLTSYNGQWYECYYIYMVNTDILCRDVFLRKYDYEYSQLAYLF